MCVCVCIHIYSDISETVSYIGVDSFELFQLSVITSNANKPCSIHLLGVYLPVALVEFRNGTILLRIFASTQLSDIVRLSCKCSFFHYCMVFCQFGMKLYLSLTLHSNILTLSLVGLFFHSDCIFY